MAEDSLIQLPQMPHGDDGSGKKTATYSVTQGSDTVHLSRVIVEGVDGTRLPIADIATMQDDIAVVKGDVATMQDDTALIKSDVATMQDDIALIKADIAAILSNQTDGDQQSKLRGSDGTIAGVAARAQTPSGNALQVQIGPGDVISNIPVITPYDHHQAHEGEMWRWAVYVSSLGNGSSKDIELVVPNITIPAGLNAVTLCPHLRFEVICDSLSQFFLYEGPTITVAGTGRTPINQERNGSYTPKLIVREDPTVTVVGTQLFQGITFSSRTSAGSTDSSTMEFVLKNNTTYLFRVTSGAAGAKVLIRLNWYEDLGV